MTTLSPIVDYPTLQAAIIAWVDRSDFATVTPLLIGLAHARMQRTLRTQDMLSRSTAAVTAGTDYVDLPNDVLEIDRVLPLTSPPSQPLNVMTRDQLARRTAENEQSSVVPTAFAFHGTKLQLSPIPVGDFTLEVSYYAAIPTLSNAAPTNWLLTAWPEAYLFGALVESAPYLRDDERMPLWKSRFEEIVNEIQAASDRREVAGGRMVSRRGPIA